MRTAQTLVQPQSSGETSALARLRNAQISWCSSTRHNNSAQYNCINGAHNIETSERCGCFNIGSDISTQQHASNQKTVHHNASTKLEETLGKLQQMFEDNAEAEASRKSAKKERHTVENIERQAAQTAHCDRRDTAA